VDIEDPSRALIKTDLPVPAILEDALGYSGARRYFAVHLDAEGGEFYLRDGEANSSGGDRLVWSILMQHPIYCSVADHFNMGRPEYRASHCLVVDRKLRIIYVADMEDSDQFLTTANEPLKAAIQPRRLKSGLDLELFLEEFSREESPEDQIRLLDEGLALRNAIELLRNWVLYEVERISPDNKTEIAGRSAEVRCIGCGCSDRRSCATLDGPCRWSWVDRAAGRGLCTACQAKGSPPLGERPVTTLPE